MRKLGLAIVALALAGFVSGPAWATDKGTGLPHGSQSDWFKLNILAFDQCPAGAMDGTNRKTIVVQDSIVTDVNVHRHVKDILSTNDILLFDSGGDSFEIRDGNACDADPAELLLPTLVATEWDVFITLIGKLGSKVDAALCATVEVEEDVFEELCSITTVKIRTKGKKSYVNVTDELLLIDGIPIFDEDLEGEFWDWVTQGQAKARLVFVPVP